MHLLRYEPFILLTVDSIIIQIINAKDKFYCSYAIISLKYAKYKNKELLLAYYNKSFYTNRIEQVLVVSIFKYYLLN